MRHARRAFTLIELLTVMAISAILMGLIVVPLMQSFNLTRLAQTYAAVQSTARQVADRIAREVSNGSSVRDNSGTAGMVAVVVPGQDGAPTEVLLPYAKIDIVDPAAGDPSAVRDGAFVNPDTGKADPTMSVPRGQAVLPAMPGLSVTRYFIGLAEPLTTAPDGSVAPGRYANPYDGLLMAKSGERDNLYVLYRAQAPVYRRNATTGRVEPNTDLFDFDAANQPVLDDPFFFVLRAAEVGTPAGTTKIARIRQWLRYANVVTELNRFDSIQPVYNKATRAVSYDGNVPRILPLVQFKPTQLSREPAAGMVAIRLGEESDSMASYGPDVYRTEFGAWVDAAIRHYAYDAGQTTGPYQVGRFGAGVPGFSVFGYDPGAGGSDLTGGTELFDVSAYAEAVALGTPYPFGAAIAAANGRSAWLGDVTLRNLFAPFTVNAKSGRIVTSFGVDEIGDWDHGGTNNWPTTPAGDTIGPAGAGANPQFTDPTRGVNNAFNKHYLERENLRGVLHRFIDLRVTPGAGSVASPLHPDPTIGFRRARIVPGSEVVIGPDQNPGANYGRPVRYTRTTREPGRNQYRINYNDLPEPDYSLFGLANPPTDYDPSDFVSSVFQPRFKVGYVQLNSDPAEPLPSGNIEVFYRFQFSQRRDVFEVDYDTRQVMSVLLTIRSYPQSSYPEPQAVTLTATGTVRNFTR